jgi:hypothetical protein
LRKVSNLSRVTRTVSSSSSTELLLEPVACTFKGAACIADAGVVASAGAHGS